MNCNVRDSREIFQSTSSIQRRTDKGIHVIVFVVFQSTSSIQRRTHGRIPGKRVWHISIHFLYTEEDLMLPLGYQVISHFNPLPLYRGGPRVLVIPCYLPYFNPLPLYRGGPAVDAWQDYRRIFQSTSSIQRRTDPTSGKEHGDGISIHFLYTEEDRFAGWSEVHIVYFNPLPLYRGGLFIYPCPWYSEYFNPLPLYRGGQLQLEHLEQKCIFQSTSSIQRRTIIPSIVDGIQQHFNPLPLYRGGHCGNR